MSNYSKIYIIASFNVERGKLYYDLCDDLVSNKPNPLEIELIKINSKKDWDFAWRKIITDIENGITPLLHFIMHGEEDGLRVDNCEKVAWKEFMDNLKILDKISPQKLSIYLQVCYGAHCIKELLNCDEPPFETMLANIDKIDICKSFMYDSDLYIELAKNHDLGDMALFYINRYNDAVCNNKRSRWVIYRYVNNLPHKLSVTYIENDMDFLQGKLIGRMD